MTEKPHEERRHYIRHPITYPVQVEVEETKYKEKTTTVNLSEGGLLFLSTTKLKKGQDVSIKLPFRDKLFDVRGRVVHVAIDVESSLFRVGLAFFEYADAFRVKLLEQLYLIEEYRHLRSLQLGREVTLREASDEWIKLYSEQFRKLYW